jgi:hypothetical protein
MPEIRIRPKATPPEKNASLQGNILRRPKFCQRKLSYFYWQFANRMHHNVLSEIPKL